MTVNRHSIPITAVLWVMDETGFKIEIKIGGGNDVWETSVVKTNSTGIWFKDDLSTV